MSFVLRPPIVHRSSCGATAFRPLLFTPHPYRTSITSANPSHSTPLILPLNRRQCLATTTSTSSSPPPFRLAIIGSGPAGFYAASRVLKKTTDAVIDMYETLPTPFGLVRYGVAPDHPEVKNCQNNFEDEVASSPRFHFIGNVSVGHSLPLSSLRPHYHAILFAYGSSRDRELGVPGEDLDGVYSARQFVAWYNGLPGFEALHPKIDQSDQAVIIGQGNVALDVARVLLTPVEKLNNTDMPEYALQTLSRNTIKKVRVIGRRGPMQAAFTIGEVREIINLPRSSFPPLPRTLFPENIKALPRQSRRLAELLIKSGQLNADLTGGNLCSLHFLLSPTSFVAKKGRPGDRELGAVRFEVNKYADATQRYERDARVVPDDAKDDIVVETGVAFRSIGYVSEPLPGLADLGVPFDPCHGIIPNIGGRVVRAPPPADEDPDRPCAEFVPGVYVAGWVKRGPTGVIATTMDDAYATADALVEDMVAGKSFASAGEVTGLGWEALDGKAEELGIVRTDWRDWKRIDEVERERGMALGKPREKIYSVSEMLKLLLCE